MSRIRALNEGRGEPCSRLSVQRQGQIGAQRLEDELHPEKCQESLCG